jgi:zinc transporter 2
MSFSPRSDGEPLSPRSPISPSARGANGTAVASTAWGRKEKRLLTAIGLASIFIVVEVIGGWIADSLAIFSDAAHLLSDVAGFGIALVAALSSKAPGSHQFTYGFARADVFGAILSIFLLWAITIWLVIEAFMRAQAWIDGNAVPVNGKIMFFIACFGVCVNLVLATVFHQEHEESFHLHGHDHTHDHAHGHAHSHGAHGGCGGSHHAEDDGHSHSHSRGYQSVATCDDMEHGHGGHSHEGHDHGHDHCEHEENETFDDHSHEHQHSATCVHAMTEFVEETDHNHGHQNNSSCAGGKPEPASLDHDHSHRERSGSEMEMVRLNHNGSSGYGSTTHDHQHEHGHSHGGANEKSNKDKSKKAKDDKKKKNKEKPKDANIEAAYLHVLTDLMQSLGRCRC